MKTNEETENKDTARDAEDALDAETEAAADEAAAKAEESRLADDDALRGPGSRSGDDAEDARDDGEKSVKKTDERSLAQTDADVEKLAKAERDELTAKEAIEDAPMPAAPVQLGYRRFVYAAYFGAAILVAFIGSKLGNQVWFRLSQWKPQWDLGDPKDELIMPIAAIVGGLVAIYYYRKPKSRLYVDEVANELSQVTWPTRKEVTNSTAVVIVTTVFATVFFALMDRFWGFVTNLVYGS